MANLIEMKVVGAEETAAAFARLKDQLPRNTVPRALRAAASWLAAEIQLVAPTGGARDPHSGRLFQSFYVKSRKAGSTLSAGVAVRRWAYYWRFLEKGWTSRGGRRFQYPFIEPLVRSRYDRAAQIVIEQVGKAIDKLGI